MGSRMGARPCIGIPSAVRALRPRPNVDWRDVGLRNRCFNSPVAATGVAPFFTGVTMSKLVQSDNATSTNQMIAARLGRWTALLLAVFAATAFAIGIATPPRSGPFCSADCLAYPYADAVRFVPRDYFWVIPSTLLTPFFVVLVACIHECVQGSRRVLSLAGLCFASISAAIITIDYFIQLQVLEPSLVREENGGLALFSQYNPHGIFIALEDLGYLMLCVAFLFSGAALGHANRLERAIRWTFLSAGLLGLACFVGMYWYFGFNLEYRFEVAIITIAWISLLVSGVMLSFFFQRCSLDVACEPGDDRYKE